MTPLHASLDSASLSRADIRPARLALATARARATLHGDRRATVQPSQAFAETPEDFTTRLLPNSGLERLLTVREVAERLRVSTAIVYKICASGELPHSRIIDSIRVRPGDLAAFAVATHSREPDSATDARNRRPVGIAGGLPHHAD